MNFDPHRNAKVIIPLAILAWLGGILVFKGGLPALFEVVFVVAFAVTVPVVVFYLIGEAGWRALARRYRAPTPFNGQWRACPTGQMALVSVNHPEFNRVRMRFVGGALRVAATPDALHPSTIFSGLPVLRMFFPPLEIPWSAIVKASAFEAPGWFKPASEPGAMLQVGYDPNYTGTFVEIEVGTPSVFIQLPFAFLGEGSARLGIVS